MAVEPSIFAALEAGLTDNPENVGLRLHLARLYAGEANWEDAWRHCAQLLVDAPEDVEVLNLAASVAEGRRFRESLAAQPSTAEPDPSDARIQAPLRTIEETLPQTPTTHSSVRSSKSRGSTLKPPR